MRFWRLSSPAYADRFDGGYGRANDGRWNRKSQLVTYCASVASLCVLQKLVHIEDVSLFPDDLRLVHYEAPDDLPVTQLEPGDPLEDGWQLDVSVSQDIGAAWYEARETALLRAPSVIVVTQETADRNYVVNHTHPDASRITLAGIKPFRLDARLLSFSTKADG